MERKTSRTSEARIRPEVASRTDSERVVRFMPERSQVLNRQNRILDAHSIIEVPENMYGQRSALDAELR